MSILIIHSISIHTAWKVSISVSLLEIKTLRSVSDKCFSFHRRNEYE